ncbi:hypothetical protein BJ875DRAFT_409072 [Amylocarpus encephaloides]|uniref:Uncharacterized protein n=1 Tax=Amylocarpus encephaloides TaxID=45428 RepID=A0A9P8C1I1_9HELO|nr:hypothetical protein BJ875DRAFT_409072 [Amylocarpus encephaloides]
MSQVWLITATSSGFGKEIALDALRKGDKVIATGRSLGKLSAVKDGGAEILELDVTSSLDNINKTVAEAHARYGKIDILVNSAGYVLEGAIEEINPKESYDQFNTNVFGALNVTRAVLPYMRAQRSGVIAMFGSLGGYHVGPAFGLYCATKAACSIISDSLRQELAPFGIQVTSIEPGYFRTGFLNPGARISGEVTIRDYEDTVVGETRVVLEKTDGKQLGDVKKGSAVVVDVLTKRGEVGKMGIPSRLVLGSDCQEAIRANVTETLRRADEWKSVSDSTDYPKE